MLNCITLFTASVYSWMCESVSARQQPSSCHYCSALYCCQNHRWQATFPGRSAQTLLSAHSAGSHLTTITPDTHRFHIFSLSMRRQREKRRLPLSLLTVKVTFTPRRSPHWTHKTHSHAATSMIHEVDGSCYWYWLYIILIRTSPAHFTVQQQTHLQDKKYRCKKRLTDNKKLLREYLHSVVIVFPFYRPLRIASHLYF